MKKAIAFLLAAGLALTALTACGRSASPGPAPTRESGQSSPPSDEPPDIRHIIGEGVTIHEIVTGEDAALAVTGCPPVGDKSTPYVYGELTRGDPFAYELITLIIVGVNYYGKKPFNDAPNGFIKADGTFSAQFSSNDGVGTDWDAEHIFLFLVPKGYQDTIEPDVASGYIVPPSQVAELKENSVCVVQIDRELL